MSFLDKVKYINQLAVVDEFGGRGHADKITRFYIVFRVTDGSGNDIEVTKEEMEDGKMPSFQKISFSVITLIIRITP